jgi:hypothetical protein
MTDNNQGPAQGTVGLLLGVCAVAFAVFLFTNGQLGGNKKVAGDQDLPPVVSPVPKTR